VVLRATPLLGMVWDFCKRCQILWRLVKSLVPMRDSTRAARATSPISEYMFCLACWLGHCVKGIKS